MASCGSKHLSLGVILYFKRVSQLLVIIKDIATGLEALLKQVKGQGNKLLQLNCDLSGLLEVDGSIVLLASKAVPLGLKAFAAASEPLLSYLLGIKKV